MKNTPYHQNAAFILRLFTGITVLFWGYEKLILEKLSKSYVMDYGRFMIFDVDLFLQILGWFQILAAVLLLLGAATRYISAIFALMGMVTLLIPGLIVMRDVPHFAYAFAFTGASISLYMTGGGPYSVAGYFHRHRDRGPAIAGRAPSHARALASSADLRPTNRKF